VYADGQIQRKNLSQQHDMAILVHDADCRPTLDPTIPPRWRPEHGESGWKSAPEGFSHAAGAETEPIDWLAYHHARRGAVIESPVTDICGYNQSQPRREEDVHAVADLLLCFWLESAGKGTLFVRAADGVDMFEVRLHFSGKGPQEWQYEAFRGKAPIPGASGSVKHAKRQLVEVSLIDRQFLLALDGRTVVAWPYERPNQPPSPPPTRLAIGVQGLEATIRSLRVYRDVYYTQPVGVRPGGTAGLPSSVDTTVGQANRATPVRLAADEYFVLGDNSPISDDSRSWPDGGGVAAKLLIGKPLVAIQAAEIILWRGLRFQVPNLGQIRYIHK
jgi:signal peptidase I